MKEEVWLCITDFDGGHFQAWGIRGSREKAQQSMIDWANDLADNPTEFSLKDFDEIDDNIGDDAFFKARHCTLIWTFSCEAIE